MSSKLLISIFKFFSLNTVSLLYQSVFKVLFMYQTWYKNFKLIESNTQLNIVYSYITLVPIDYHLSCQNIYLYSCQNWRSRYPTYTWQIFKEYWWPNPFPVWITSYDTHYINYKIWSLLWVWKNWLYEML